MSQQLLDGARSATNNTTHAKIEAKRVVKLYPTPGTRRGTTTVLDGFDLRIESGEFVSLLGPSGCGKSTYLNILAGLESYNGGAVLIDGKRVDGVDKNVGVVFQGYALFPWLTAQKNVEVGLKIRGVPKAERRARAAEVLKTVGLESAADRLPHQLSGGMRQRVAIARVLAYEPEILVFDEPFAALDAQTREFLQGELLRIWESGEKKKTVLFVTHSIDEAVFLSDRIAVMTKSPGRVKDIIDVDLPRHRDNAIRSSEEFVHVRSRVARVLEDEVNNVLGAR
ncbi:ABC transporter ATP-binding protein [Rhodococcus sp. 15-649-1-2]|uniref:ABC transporter ATP-binding protein n=1 Tax=Nocardiaceae TaxID=85025 RepID=UPI00036E5FCB|nr:MULTISPECIES: ABC transporter ATP-binding protein [Rhodococcus]OZC60190.1 ABC transporter ATP-binding protein [Rhodococcus sp. 06-621-2]OZC78542.1 ABC transporter ATP-binding protein [Rhodococcus sp. 06-418-1B]OZD10839.1 ABC transporter ATP-binding protein [Rhodococcus sp. 06-156-4C]OZD11500.1 ABC transporter ATP-binding protein [Rhodococcus sp. 06-156-3C]OZD13735.1 ABC transporter ATP-binding protein [Rhodococcus sp. 06-156-4a]